MTSVDAAVASARSDETRAVLEGFHALKHALRFGADIRLAVATDVDAVLSLAADLAPDLLGTLADILSEVDEATFVRCAPRPPATGVVSVAVRHDVPTTTALASPGPAILLDTPRHHGNVGAVIRACAALGGAAVLTTGDLDPWHAAALRGSAGLHFAIAVARVADIPVTSRPVIAFHPDGEPLGPDIPSNALLCLGSERSGLSAETLDRADRTVSIPMADGVSSLNLATAAAIALFAATPQ